MELSVLAEKRRSIRKYTNERISKETLEEIISFAQKAPSWKNSQTGRYYVALSDEAISAVYEALPEFNRRSSQGAAYIVSSFKRGLSGGLKENEMSKEGDLWGSYDLGLQNCYLLLKAAELGYDTLIMGIRDDEALRAYFEIPEDEIILPVIAIGKRDIEPNRMIRKDLAEVLKVR